MTSLRICVERYRGSLRQRRRSPGKGETVVAGNEEQGEAVVASSSIDTNTSTSTSTSASASTCINTSASTNTSSSINTRAISPSE